MEYQNRSPIDTIESRLSNIERRVYGKSNPSFKEKEDAASEVIEWPLKSCVLRILDIFLSS